MKGRFYKLDNRKMISGVLAGIADKFGWHLDYLRLLFFVFGIFNPVIAIIAYALLSHVLVSKEAIERERYGQGPRKVKEAEVIHDKDSWFF